MAILRTKFAFDSAVSLVTKAAEVLLSLIVVVLLGRMLGAEGFGIYAFSMAVVSIASMPTRLGLPELVVRETASSQATQRWETIVGLWRWSTAAAWALGSAVAIIGMVLIAHLGRDAETVGRTLLVGFLLVPLLSLSNLRSGILRGLRYVGSANFIGLLAQPLVFILLLAGFMLANRGSLTPPEAIGLTVVSAFFSFMLGTWIIRRRRPADTFGVVPRFTPGKWIAGAWPMAMTQGAHQINRYVDVVILGLLANMIDAGIYRVAAQGAVLVSLGMIAMELVIAPRLAHLHALGQQEHMQKILRRSTQIAFMLSVAVALGFAIAGQPILIWFFGDDFGSAWLPLIILSMAHVISTAIGPTGLILNMTGYERYVTRAVTIAALVNIALNFALIPLFGAVGAAIATGIALIFWKAWLWFTAKRKLGVRCSFL